MTWKTSIGNLFHEAAVLRRKLFEWNFALMEHEGKEDDLSLIKGSHVKSNNNVI